MAMTTFLFLRITHDPLELPPGAVTRGEPRMVRTIVTPVPVPPSCEGLPDRDISTAAPHSSPTALRTPKVSLVTIDVHGSLDRAKDVSSSVEALLRRLTRRVRALGARRRRSPPHSSRGHLLSSVRPIAWDEPRTTESDRPRSTLLRQPAKAIGIPWTRVPSTVANRGDGRGSLLFVSRVGLPLTPPTRCPHGWGQCAF
jgi:hypothetical protein